MFSLFKRKKTPPQEVAVEKEYRFDDSVAKQILSAIKEEFGLDYAKQEYATMRRLERFAIKNDFYDFETLKEAYEREVRIKEGIVDMLTVSETYFFRELAQIEYLCVIAKEQSIKRVLCAPSATGEEIYSILIKLKEAGLLMGDFEIVGVDVNNEVLQTARDGCYSDRSLSRVDTTLKTKYFHTNSAKNCITPELKRYATFQRKNVFDASFAMLGTFDAVFSRNMLIYFEDSDKKKAIASLLSVLKSGGHLFLGHADLSFEPDGVQRVLGQKATYIRR